MHLVARPGGYTPVAGGDWVSSEQRDLAALNGPLCWANQHAQLRSSL